MSLLAELFSARAADPGYADAAARRAARGEPPGTRGRGAGVLLVVALVGVLLAVAGAEARRREPVAAQERARLVKEIRARTAESDALRRRADAARAEAERLRAAALAGTDAGHRARRALSAAQAAAAAAPARGAALVVTVDDAPHGAGDGGGRVYDQDLQVLVNDLWGAGATAIGVNGLRLTATSAIRGAGEAVLVDYRPLTRPYTVTALGDPERLSAALAGSAADRRLAALRDRYRLRYERRVRSDARLPAGTVPEPRHARPVEEGERGR